MGMVEELYAKRLIFDDFFKEVHIVLESKNFYDYPTTKYDKYFFTVTCEIDFFEEEIQGKVTHYSGEIHKTIVRLFHPDIPPQLVEQKETIPLFKVDVMEYLFDDNWHVEFRDFLLDSLYKEVRTIMVKNINGEWVDYPIGIRKLEILYKNN
ncbi:hypothetical protein ACERII_07355 [Evansella sp. AB-rgal1]|uniref:hypothetical protein n=1 Tax=Evansella sp. AB-rgal1 TaxID=3242696 RepID=UPI00359E61F5